MAYCWIKKRGKVYYLHFAKGVGRKPRSLNTSDQALAREAQRRAGSKMWCNVRGIKRRIAERVRYSDLLRRFVEHRTASGIDPRR